MNNLYKYLIGGSFALGTFALIVSAPETAKNLKPLKNDRLQEIVDYQNKIFTDKETGIIYGWIEGAGGEWRFVKMDKNSENKVRSEKLRYLDVGKPHGAVNQHSEVDRFVLNINLAPKLDLHIDEQIEKEII